MFFMELVLVNPFFIHNATHTILSPKQNPYPHPHPGFLGKFKYKIDVFTMELGISNVI